MMWSQQQQIKMQCIEFISSSGISRTDERSSTFRLFIFFYAPFCCCSFPWIYTVYHDIDSGRSTLWENLLNTVRIIRKLIYFFWPIFFEQAQFHFTRCLNIVIIDGEKDEIEQQTSLEFDQKSLKSLIKTKAKLKTMLQQEQRTDGH